MIFAKKETGFQHHNTILLKISPQDSREEFYQHAFKGIDETGLFPEDLQTTTIEMGEGVLFHFYGLFDGLCIILLNETLNA